AATVLCSSFMTSASAMASSAAPAVRGAVSSGTWGTAELVPGSDTLNVGKRASIASVSCASAGDCGAGGYYASSSAANGQPIPQAMVVTENGGQWGTAVEVPGTATLN